MKLAILAKKAAALPADLNFDWTGPECFHDEVFKREVKTLPEAIAYIDKLRERMAAYGMALHDLSAAYRQMRDLMLEADVECPPPS